MNEKTIKGIHELIDLVGTRVKENLVLFLRIVTNPKSFILSRNLAESSEFVAASIFALFVSLIGLVIGLPGLRRLGVDSESVSFLILDTVLTYAVWFLIGVCFHIGSRIVRGKAALQSSVIVFLYMTAYQPIIHLIGYPYYFALRQDLAGSQNLYSSDSIIVLFERITSSPLLIASAILSTLFFFYYLVRIGGVFRQIHKLGWFRGLIAITIGFLSWCVIDVIVSVPILHIMIDSFH